VCIFSSPLQENQSAKFYDQPKQPGEKQRKPGKKIRAQIYRRRNNSKGKEEKQK
jgi:hypothetical protein